jgi:hypothetical protein
MCATREKGVSQLLLMLSMLAAGPAMAQGPIHVRFAPRVGIVAPDERLYARSERTASDLLGYAATLETSPSIGAALLVGSQDLGVFLHLAVDHAPSTDANLVVFGPPSDLAAAVTHRAVFPATLTEFGASMVLPMRLELGPFRPFATADWDSPGIASPHPSLGCLCLPVWQLRNQAPLGRDALVGASTSSCGTVASRSRSSMPPVAIGARRITA